MKPTETYDAKAPATVRAQAPRSGRARTLATFALLAVLPGCAPIGALAPRGMTTAVAPDAIISVPDPHHLGEVFHSDSLVVLLVGDNRPGYRIQSQRFGYPQVRRFSAGRPATWLPAVFGLPLALIQTVIPTLDGPQDLVAGFATHRPNGGGEAQVLKAMTRRLPANLTINTGDLVFDGRRARLWADFERKFGTPDDRGFRAQSLYLAAPGNHERLDTAEGRANWSVVMGAPPRPERFWFSIDVGAAARFVFLDSNVLANVDGVYSEETAAALASEQLAWLDRSLDTRVPYRFVILHHPLVMVGSHGSDWLPVASARRRDQVLEILARRGVTAVFAGHEHLYARVFARAETSADTAWSPYAGFWHVTTGGGGGPLHRVDPPTRTRELARTLPAGLTFAPGSDRAETTYHFMRLVLPGLLRSGAIIDVGRQPRVDVYAVNQRGEERLIERLSLAPPD